MNPPSNSELGRPARAEREPALGYARVELSHSDLSRVLAMCQAISAEYELDGLIKRTLSLAFELVPVAVKGLLMIRQEGQILRAAEASRDAGTTRVSVLDETPGPPSLPHGLLRHVEESGEGVLVGDAAAQGTLDNDPYVVRQASRSMLCVPLKIPPRRMGMLLLENPLLPHAFDPAQATALELLASQAAICLGNAQRHSELQCQLARLSESQQALRRSEERYALAVAAVGDGLTDWMVATDEFFASPRMLEMCGYPPEREFSGRDDFISSFPFHPTDRERVLRAISEHFEGTGNRLEIDTRILLDDEVRWLHLTMLFSRDAHGILQRSSTAVTDVTDRRRAEDALRQSEERFALAVAGSNQGIFDWNLVDDSVYLSSRAQELYGLTASGTMWRQREEWSQLINFHPDEIAELRKVIREHIDGDSPSYDFRYRAVLRDGSFRWFRQRGTALRDADGIAYRMVGYVSDVTEAKLAEEEVARLERRLRQAQRLEAMGTLAGGIAHDFNNILGAVLGFGDRAKRDVPRGSRLQRDLDSIVAAGERGRALVDRILAFSSSSVGERVPVQVESVAREALDLIAAKLPPTVRITVDLRSGAATTQGDSTQLHQVIMNLATNAVQAMPTGGRLDVGLAVETVDEPRLASVGRLEPGEHVVLTVSDTGIGMTPDVLERIFDPFFTTKDLGAGTGLGLSLVHGIVTDMSGALDVVSAPGDGSRFVVYLPRIADVAGPAGGQSALRAAAMPRGARQRLLVVDDEEPLVRLATETLQEQGYVAEGFTSSIAALAAFQQAPERFDAVITDERMPGMAGLALIGHVRALRKDIPVVLMSGFVGGGVLGRARELGADEVLKKPLSGSDLADCLARLLATRSP